MLHITDIVLLIGAYLLGSIPFGLFIARRYGIKDIQQRGSGNIGATNVVRVAGKKAGIITFVCDALKGVIPVLIAKHFALSPMTIWLAAALAVLGHIFPVWLKFRGGKGVATTLAVITAVHPPLGLLTIGTWLLTYAILHISSLSAILAMLAMPSFAFYYADTLGYDMVYLCLFLAIVVVVRHHTNIRRLMRGEEKPV